MKAARSYAGLHRADGLAIFIASSRLGSAIRPWQIERAFDRGEVTPGAYEFRDGDSEVAAVTIRFTAAERAGQ